MSAKWLGSVIMALLVICGSARAASMAIPAGATVNVRMAEALDSRTNHSGEIFHGTLDAPVLVNGTTVIPKGAEVIGRITDVESSGRLRGRAILALELTALNFDGKSLAVQTNTVQQSSLPRGRQSMKIAGSASAVGAIVGLVGGAPWLGSGVGAAAGILAQTVRGRSQIHIPSESLLSFTLLSPLPVE